MITKKRGKVKEEQERRLPVQMHKNERTRVGVRDEVAIRLYIEKIMEASTTDVTINKRLAARESLEDADIFLKERDSWKIGDTI